VRVEKQNRAAFWRGMALYRGKTITGDYTHLGTDYGWPAQTWLADCRKKN